MTSSRPTPAREPEPTPRRRSASFHFLPISDRPMTIRRPDSHPELLRRLTGNPVSPEWNDIGGGGGGGGRGGQKLTKLLLNVTIQRSLGPVHVVISPESTVADLIRAAVETYVKEGRRPLLPETVPWGFELHYSQFSLENLNREEKLRNLGSRNFFLCHKPKAEAAADCHSDEGKKASSKSLLLLSKIHILLG